MIGFENRLVIILETGLDSFAHPSIIEADHGLWHVAEEAYWILAGQNNEKTDGACFGIGIHFADIRRGTGRVVAGRKDSGLSVPTDRGDDPGGESAGIQGGGTVDAASRLVRGADDE